MGRRLDIPWLEVNIPWLPGVNISWVGGRYAMGRVRSICH